MVFALCVIMLLVLIRKHPSRAKEIFLSFMRTCIEKTIHVGMRWECSRTIENQVRISAFFLPFMPTSIEEMIHATCARIHVGAEGNGENLFT